MKKVLLFTCLIAASVSLGACSGTLDGVGRDVSKAGEKIQKTF